MAARCDAHEVLLAAMRRPNELGFAFKWKALLAALKVWGDAGEVSRLCAVMLAVEDAGLRPDERLAYVVVRAAVNARDWGQLDAALAWLAARGVERAKPATTALLAQAERLRSVERAEGGSAGSTPQLQGEKLEADESDEALLPVVPAGSVPTGPQAAQGGRS
jgi:hypothetical protein